MQLPKLNWAVRLLPIKASPGTGGREAGVAIPQSCHQPEVGSDLGRPHPLFRLIARDRNLWKDHAIYPDRLTKRAPTSMA